MAVIYTHSHLDHFAGLAGVIDTEELAACQVPIVAPEGFLEAAVSENVIAGPAMVRRAGYMYGNHLPRGPEAQVDCGLGRSIPTGSVSLVAPTHEITHTGEELVLDGVRIVFQLTPEAEAPAEMMFHFPHLRALCAAENCTSVMHNLYTLRGAQVRDALAWSKYVNEALRLFGDSSDLVFASHNWPRFGADEVRHYLRTQRDTYRYLHDQTMRLANRGLVMTEIAEELSLPPSLAGEFGNRGLLRHRQPQREGGVPALPRLVRRQPRQPAPAAAGAGRGPVRRVHGRRRRRARTGAGRLRSGRLPVGGAGRQPRRVRRPRQHRGPRAPGRRARATRVPGRVGALAELLPDGRAGAAARGAPPAGSGWPPGRRVAPADDRRDGVRLARRAPRRAPGRR